LALAQFIFELFSLAAWQFCYFTGSQNVEMKNCHDRAENGHVVVALVAYILVNVFSLLDCLRQYVRVYVRVGHVIFA